MGRIPNIGSHVERIGDMADLIYAVCVASAFVFAWLLLCSYRQDGHRLLLWIGLCFLALFVNNLLPVFDKLMFPSVDMSTYRLLPALVGMVFLLYGLVWEDR